MIAYSTPEVVMLTGASYRQVDYWDRVGLATPSLRAAAGSGTQREYASADVWRIALIRALLVGGLGLAAVRQVIDEITPTGQAHLGRVAIHVDRWALMGDVLHRLSQLHQAPSAAVPPRLRLVPEVA